MLPHQLVAWSTSVVFLFLGSRPNPSRGGGSLSRALPTFFQRLMFMPRCRSVWTPLALVGLGGALLGAPAAASAQSAVRGTVTDSASSRPIPGAQVFVVGTTRGAVTDSLGRYIIRNLPGASATITARLIGYAPVTRRATIGPADTAIVNFALTATAVLLSETVVVGYGETSRQNVSSAIASVQPEEIINAPVAGIDAALQGKAAGVQVIQNAGNPGNGITVRVRGAASLSASNQPLYVVDGVPIIREDYSQLGLGGQGITAVTGLAPDEIESLDVLKDAAAAAIYGSRASNGVILVTTKRGRSGQAKINFSAYTGTQSPTHLLGLLNAHQYVEYMNEAYTNDQETAPFKPGVTDSISTDWQRTVMRDAPVSNLNLSAQGGTDRVRYYLSGSLFDQKGILLSSGYQRYNGRLNLDMQATNKLSVKTSIGLVRENNSRVENDNTINGVGANATALQPFLPVRINGGFSTPSDGLEYTNPVAIAAYNTNTSSTLRAIGDVEATYGFSDRVRLTGRVGTDIYTLQDQRWQSPKVAGTYAVSANGVGILGNTTASRYLAESFLTVSPFQSARQSLDVTLGASGEFNDSQQDYLRGEGFSSDATRLPGSASKIVTYSTPVPTQYNLISGFARVNYTLLDRYLATASFRRDGSSRFGPNNRYGDFPAVSLGWRITDEPALHALRRIGDLKLRASYGQTGNQGISSDFAYLGRFATANYKGDPGIRPSALQSPGLKWESTAEQDYGADWSTLNGRLTVIGDYYVKTTKDLLVQRPITSTSGFTTYWDNIGDIENRGWELAISTVNLRTSKRGLGWTTDFNISHNANKVTKLFQHQPFTAGFSGINRIQEGQPLGAFYTLRFKGVDPQTGNAIYDDVNKDGKVNSDDRVIVGTPHPKYWGGLTNALTFRNFNLRTFLEFTRGNQVFNSIRPYADDGGYYNDNKFDVALTRWRKPGDITTEPRASTDGTSGARTVSSRFIEDGSYVRVSEITLGFRLPARIAQLARLSDANLFVSGRNLKLFTKYTGYDPDVNSSGSDANLSLGTDFYAYPRARTITFGINGSW